jgi:predicted PurR-regulated permease PerM
MTSVVLVIASLYWAKAVLIPLALALMLTFLLQPIVAALHRRRLGHTPATVWLSCCSGSAPSAGW